MISLRYLILLMCILSGACTVSAQMPIKLRVLPEVPPDSADVAYYSKPHFWRAAGEVVGFNPAYGHLTAMCSAEILHT